MDAVTRLQKFIQEHQESAAPPPYTETESDNDSDSDSDDSGMDDEAPVKLIINAAHSIQGSNNLIPTSSTPLADSSKFATLLLHAVNQINGLNRNSEARRRTVKVDLTINCGLTVIGDRNVVGNVGLKPRSAAGVIAGPATVAGAKRKVEEREESEEPAAKRVAVAGGRREE